MVAPHPWYNSKRWKIRRKQQLQKEPLCAWRSRYRKAATRRSNELIRTIIGNRGLTWDCAACMRIRYPRNDPHPNPTGSISFHAGNAASPLRPSVLTRNIAEPAASSEAIDTENLANKFNGTGGGQKCFGGNFCADLYSAAPEVLGDFRSLFEKKKLAGPVPCF